MPGLPPCGRDHGQSCAAFTWETQKVFNHSVRDKDTASCLLSLPQGPCGVMELTNKIWTLTVERRWNEEALHCILQNSLNDNVKDILVSQGGASDFNQLIFLAIQPSTTICLSAIGRGPLGQRCLSLSLQQLPVVSFQVIPRTNGKP